jgi:hypothetical protein
MALENRPQLVDRESMDLCVLHILDLINLAMALVVKPVSIANVDWAFQYLRAGRLIHGLLEEIFN